jgi:hypothetical protein
MSRLRKKPEKKNPIHHSLRNKKQKPRNKLNEGGERPVQGKLQNTRKKLKPTLTEGKPSCVHGLEK